VTPLHRAAESNQGAAKWGENESFELKELGFLPSRVFKIS